MAVPSFSFETHGDDRNEKETILAHFNNGRIRDDKQKAVRFGLFRHKGKDTKSKRRRILVGETDRMDYVGDNFGPQASKVETAGLCKYMIGILDKKTGKMRLVDTKLMQMTPKLPGQGDSQDELDAAKELSYREKTDRLVDAFGSSKKQRAMHSRLRNQIKGAALEEAIGVAVDHALVNNANLQSPSTPTAMEMSGSIPPFNLDAKTPDEVYLMKDIISDSEFEALRIAEDTFVSVTREQLKEWKEKETYPGNVLYHLSSLPVDTDARSYKARQLLYLTYMNTLYRLNAADLRKKDPLPTSVPDIVKKKLLDRYTVSAVAGNKTVRCMPTRLKDKLVSYILVLSLILDEFSMEITQLQKDLKMGLQKITTHLRALGCTVKTQKIDMGGGLPKSDIRMAELKIPLTFPENRKRGKR